MALPPDPDSMEQWKALPQSRQSRQALPPAAGGMWLSRTLLIGLFILTVAVIIMALFMQPGAS